MIRTASHSAPVHPGEILGDWMAEEGLSANALAKALHVPHNRMPPLWRESARSRPRLPCGSPAISATSADMWMGLQADYDREVAERDMGERIAREVAPRRSAARAA